MNFLNSTILAGLVAALAPLVIHLLNRQKVRTVEFSSLRFLRDLQKTKMRRLKLRQALLLIIRTLIVVFAVLAFARPTIKGDAFRAVGAHARTTAVILIDHSASMQARTADGSAAERASRKAAQIVKLLREGDQAVRGTFDQAVQFSPATSDFAGLSEGLREQVPGAGSTDVISAIAGAEQVLTESKNLNREIYVISDLARNGFTTAAALPLPTAANAGHIYLVNVRDRRVINAAVTAVRFAGQLIEPGVPFEITATVVNRSEETFDHLLAGVFVDGRRLAQSDVSLAARATGEVSFRIQADSAGMHQGYVELADDDNLADNRCFFAFRIPGRINVLLASDFPSDRAYVLRALAPGGTGRLSVTERDTRELVRENLAEYDAVVLAAARKLEPLLVENFDRYLRAGGGILVVPSADVDTAAYNTGLLRRYFGCRIAERPIEFPSPEQYFVLENIDWQHPVLSIYHEVPKEKIPEIRFYSRFRLAEAKDVRAVARFPDGQPAWAEAAVGRGKLFFWTAPLDPTYSDISFHSLFVPLLNRSVEYLAAELGEQAVDYRVGQPISRPRDISWRGPLVLKFPDGRSEMLAAEVARQADLYATPPLMEPGCYTVLDGEKPVDVFAVNIDADETNVQPTDAQEINTRLPGRRVTIIDAGDDPTQVVLAGRYGREIWKPLLWAVLGLLFTETLLARTRKSELPPDLTG